MESPKSYTHTADPQSPLYIRNILVNVNRTPNKSHESTNSETQRVLQQMVEQPSPLQTSLLLNLAQKQNNSKVEIQSNSVQMRRRENKLIKFYTPVLLKKSKMQNLRNKVQTSPQVRVALDQGQQMSVQEDSVEDGEGSVRVKIVSQARQTTPSSKKCTQESEDLIWPQGYFAPDELLQKQFDNVQSPFQNYIKPVEVKVFNSDHEFPNDKVQANSKNKFVPSLMKNLSFLPRKVVINNSQMSKNEVPALATLDMSKVVNNQIQDELQCTQQRHFNTARVTDKTQNFQAQDLPVQNYINEKCNNIQFANFNRVKNICVNDAETLDVQTEDLKKVIDQRQLSGKDQIKAKLYAKICKNQINFHSSQTDQNTKTTKRSLKTSSLNFRRKPQLDQNFFLNSFGQIQKTEEAPFLDGIEFEDQDFLSKSNTEQEFYIKLLREGKSASTKSNSSLAYQKFLPQGYRRRFQALKDLFAQRAQQQARNNQTFSSDGKTKTCKRTLNYIESPKKTKQAFSNSVKQGKFETILTSEKTDRMKQTQMLMSQICQQEQKSKIFNEVSPRSNQVRVYVEQLTPTAKKSSDLAPYQMANHLQMHNQQLVRTGQNMQNLQVPSQQGKKLLMLPTLKLSNCSIQSVMQSGTNEPDRNQPLQTTDCSTISLQNNLVLFHTCNYVKRQSSIQVNDKFCGSY